MDALLDELVEHYNYYAYVVLILIGFHAMITRTHLVRQLIGLTIFQASIILFFISTGAKWDAALPVVPVDGAVSAADYSNPLPHALMLTAIVVAVATQGLAMALLIRIQREFRTLDEDDLVEAMQKRDLDLLEPGP